LRDGVYSVPAQETAKHRVWLASGERRRCSNEANRRKPLKFARVPETPKQNHSRLWAEVRQIVGTCGRDIAV